MPIPTRSQSVKTSAHTGIPTRKPSTRQAQTLTDDARSGHTPQTRSTANTVTRLETQSSTTQDRNVSRSKSGLAKPTVPQVVDNTASSNSAKSIRAPSARIAGKLATEASKISQTQPQITTAKTQPSIRGHVRSTSMTSTTLATRLANRKATGASTGQQIILTKRITQPKHAASESGEASAGLRNELVQLQLVHQGSAQNLESYGRSIDRNRRTEVQKLSELQNDVSQLEAVNKQAASSHALRKWMDQYSDHPSAYHIQRLSNSILELENCVNEFGDLEPLEQFESWLSETMLLQENRNAGLDRELRFVASLGGAWHEQMATLKSKLSVILATFEQFETAEDGSGLAWVLENSAIYIKTLLQEVESALSLERIVMQHESSWEAKEVSVAVSNENTVISAPRAGIWID